MQLLVGPAAEASVAALLILLPQREQLAVCGALQPCLHLLRPKPLLAWGGAAAEQLHEHHVLEPAPFLACAVLERPVTRCFGREAKVSLVPAPQTERRTVALCRR